MKWFLSIAAVVILSGGLVAGVYGASLVMGFSLAAFVALLIAANLDRISEFKASGRGVEAKTREILAQAKSAISELQLLAQSTGELTLSLVKRSGRFGGYADDEAESIKRRVLDVLTKLGVRVSEHPEILDEWHRFTEFDYAHAILGGGTIPSGVDGGAMAEWSALREGGITHIPSTDEIRAFLEKHELINEALLGYLDDYEYYRKHKVHRRPEVWRDRPNWGHLQKT
jgi:hypothetical protein